MLLKNVIKINICIIHHTFTANIFPHQSQTNDYGTNRSCAKTSDKMIMQFIDTFVKRYLKITIPFFKNISSQFLYGLKTKKDVK